MWYQLLVAVKLLVYKVILFSVLFISITGQVTSIFGDDSAALKSMKDGFASTINQDVGKMASLLAVHLDHLLKVGRAALYLLTADRQPHV